MFSLKYPPLLQFDHCRGQEILKHNLRSLEVQQASYDTCMRERLDEVDPKAIQKSFDRIIALLHRAIILEKYRQS